MSQYQEDIFFFVQSYQNLSLHCHQNAPLSDPMLYCYVSAESSAIFLTKSVSCRWGEFEEKQNMCCQQCSLGYFTWTHVAYRTKTFKK